MAGLDFKSAARERWIMSVKKRVCFAAVVAIIIVILYYANRQQDSNK